MTVEENAAVKPKEEKAIPPLLVAYLSSTRSTELQQLVDLHRHSSTGRRDAFDGRSNNVSSRCFTPLTATRKRAFPTLTNSSSTGSIATDKLITSVLRMLFRRFAGKMLLKGKLLNHEELLVTAFRRLPIDPQDLCVHIASESLRFIVHCEDTTTTQIGHEIVAQLQPHVYTVVTEDSDVVMATCCGCEQYAANELELWRQVRFLEQMDVCYGFDIRMLLTGHSTKLLLDFDADEAPNMLISRASAFRDLRCSQQMMVSYNLPLQSGNFQSFVRALKTKETTVSENHPFSYLSLGIAQKKLWADERFKHGQALIAKGKTKDAVIEFSSCLKLCDDHVAARAARGQANSRLQQFSEAIRDLERVLELDPSWPNIMEDVLRAKGRLTHSRHVSSAAGTSVQLPTQIRTPSGSRDESADKRSLMEKADSIVSRSRTDQERSLSSTTTTKFEKDRLQRLLEEEKATWKRHRHRKRSRHNSDSDNSSIDSDDGSRGSKTKNKKQTKHSSSKKEKKSHKKKKKKKHSHSTSDKHSSTNASRHHKSRRRSNSSGSSSGYSSSSSTYTSYRSSRQRRFRSVGSGSGGGRTQEPDENHVHPILLRQQHRIWN